MGLIDHCLVSVVVLNLVDSELMSASVLTELEKVSENVVLFSNLLFLKGQTGIGILNPLLRV